MQVSSELFRYSARKAKGKGLPGVLDKEGFTLISYSMVLVLAIVAFHSAICFLILGVHQN